MAESCDLEAWSSLRTSDESIVSFEKLKANRDAEARRGRARAERLRRCVIERGAPVFERYGAQKVVLFGSVAEGRCGPRSDVDLLVQPVSNEHYWGLRHDLEEALGVPLDLYTDRDDPRFVRRILERGEVVYEV